MVSCFKVCGYCTTIIVLLAVGLQLYIKYGDQREFNFNTTADVAATNSDLTGQIIIVTGSNTGIGKATAEILLSHGATVIMACRNPQKCANAKNDIINKLLIENFKNASKQELQQRIDTMTLDLASLDSIKQFVYLFEFEYSQLNQLILNAGIMALPQFKTTQNGIERQFGVNHVGHFYLSMLLTHLLVNSASNSDVISRVISVSSNAHRMAPKQIHLWLENDSMVHDEKQYGAWSAYGFSKACNVLFAMEYTKRFSKDNVYAVSISPGPVDTELARNLDSKIIIVMKVLSPVIKMFLKTPSQGAATTVRSATISDVEFMESAGGYWDNCNLANEQIRNDLFEENVNENGKSPKLLLWEMTQSLLDKKSKDLTFLADTNDTE